MVAKSDNAKTKLKKSTLPIDCSFDYSFFISKSLSIVFYVETIYFTQSNSLLHWILLPSFLRSIFILKLRRRPHGNLAYMCQLRIGLRYQRNVQNILQDIKKCALLFLLYYLLYNCSIIKFNFKLQYKYAY